MLLDEPQVRRWTKQEYYQAAELGWFAGQRVELVDGEVIEMAPQKDAHAFAVRLAASALQRVFGPDFTVLVQMPLNLGPGSEPEPDVAVVKGSLREVREHPTSAELVVEVADSSLGYDRQRKAELYSRSGVPEYWIGNLLDKQIEAYRPTASGGAAAYGRPQIVRAGETIRPLAPAATPVAADELLP